MKNFILISLLILPVVVFSQQRQTFGKGIINVNLGAGFPNKTHAAIDAASSLSGILGGSNRVSRSDNGSSTPFFNLSADYGINDQVSLGVFTGYFRSTNEVSAASSLIDTILGNESRTLGKTTYNVISIGGKLIVHRPILKDIEKLDTYASTYYGYNIVKDDTTLNVSDNGTINSLANTLFDQTKFPKVTYEINAGAKYAISDNISIFGEAGYGRFLVNAGLTYTLSPKPQVKDKSTEN